MTTIAIMPVVTGDGSIVYCGMAGEKRSEGDTAGKALDALTAQLPETQDGLLVIVQSLRLGRFFDVQQQRRFRELMEALRWAGGELPAEEEAELESLVGVEVRASADRTAMFAAEIGRWST